MNNYNYNCYYYYNGLLVQTPISKRILFPQVPSTPTDSTNFLNLIYPTFLSTSEIHGNFFILICNITVKPNHLLISLDVSSLFKKYPFPIQLRLFKIFYSADTSMGYPRRFRNFSFQKSAKLIYEIFFIWLDGEKLSI